MSASELRDAATLMLDELAAYEREWQTSTTGWAPIRTAKYALRRALDTALQDSGLDAGIRVEGLDLDELHAAIATADNCDPNWLDKYRHIRDERIARATAYDQGETPA